MDAAWGPGNATRGALAFVHIPPYVLPLRTARFVWCADTVFSCSGGQACDSGAPAGFEPHARPGAQSYASVPFLRLS